MPKKHHAGTRAPGGGVPPLKTRPDEASHPNLLPDGKILLRRPSGSVARGHRANPMPSTGTNREIVHMEQDSPEEDGLLAELHDLGQG